MIIAITGANGHVGVNLCKALLDKGHHVRGLVHNNFAGLENLNVEKFPGEILDKDSLREFVKGSEIVFHLAAKISITGDSRGIVKAVNTEGTRNITELCIEYGVRRLIHFSSIHAIQQVTPEVIMNEHMPLVGDKGFAYDRSKADSERTVMRAAKNGLDAIVLSPTAIIGPMDHEPSLMGKALLQIYSGHIPALVPGGYNWVDVRDVVQAAVSSIENGRKGEKYLLSANWHSINEVARIIESHTGKKVVSAIMPFWVAWVGLPFISLFSKITSRTPLYTRESLEIIISCSRNVSHDKAGQELGFNPRTIEETVKDTMDWFESNGKLKS